MELGWHYNHELLSRGVEWGKDGPHLW
jgi:hypothetical protein